MFVIVGIENLMGFVGVNAFKMSNLVKLSLFITFFFYVLEIENGPFCQLY